MQFILSKNFTLVSSCLGHLCSSKIVLCAALDTSLSAANLQNPSHVFSRRNQTLEGIALKLRKPEKENGKIRYRKRLPEINALLKKHLGKGLDTSLLRRINPARVPFMKDKYITADLESLSSAYGKESVRQLYLTAPESITVRNSKIHKAVNMIAEHLSVTPKEVFESISKNPEVLTTKTETFLNFYDKVVKQLNVPHKEVAAWFIHHPTLFQLELPEFRLKWRLLAESVVDYPAWQMQLIELDPKTRAQMLAVLPVSHYRRLRHVLQSGVAHKAPFTTFLCLPDEKLFERFPELIL